MIEEDKKLIKYFIDKATLLSLDYEEQLIVATKWNLGDYFTEDIANDWFTEEVAVIEEMIKKGLIGAKSAILYSTINMNFDEVSLRKRFDEADLWTLNALENHVFWKEQRFLARQFIKELQKQ